MDGRGATTERSLSDGASLLSISAAIEQHHLHGFIFHLLMKILKFAIRDKELVSVLLSIDNKS